MDKNCMRARLGGEIGEISGYNFVSYMYVQYIRVFNYVTFLFSKHQRHHAR